MKSFLKVALMGAAMMVAIPCLAGDKTGKEMSADCKKQISAVNSEIKAIKAKIKTEPNNTTYKIQLDSKQAELVVLKENQKIFDKAAKLEADAIKALKDADKAVAEIQKAERKAANAQDKAEKLHQRAAQAVNDANKLRQKD